MPEDDQIETVRRWLSRAGLTPSEADLARIATFVGQPYPRAPKRATEPYVAGAFQGWGEQQ